MITCGLLATVLLQAVSEIKLATKIIAARTDRYRSFKIFSFGSPFSSTVLDLSIPVGAVFTKMNEMLVVWMRRVFFDRLALLEVEADVSAAI